MGSADRDDLRNRRSGQRRRDPFLGVDHQNPRPRLENRRVLGIRRDKIEIRILEPAENVLAFYEGRVEGYLFAEQPNWVDEGAISLGIASYAILAGREALVYDTHVSVERGRFIRRALEERGVERVTVLLSHWHLDHIAGNEAFGDCEILATARTAELLEANRAAIEAGTLEGPPPVDPLVAPTRAISDRERLEIGGTEVEAVAVNIHSDDAAVLWLPGQRLLLCGDTMEDTVTYVEEPERFDAHLADLERLALLEPERILPCHGDPDLIAAGGYTAGLIAATRQYIEVLRRCREDPKLRELPLRELIAGPLEAGWVHYFEPYEAVHRENLKAVTGVSS
jgi:glyoxylase-like metal-dependent hydrolase (beta-lactamase superfamily II)